MLWLYLDVLGIAGLWEMVLKLMFLMQQASGGKALDDVPSIQGAVHFFGKLIIPQWLGR